MDGHDLVVDVHRQAVALDDELRARGTRDTRSGRGESNRRRSNAARACACLVVRVILESASRTVRRDAAALGGLHPRVHALRVARRDGQAPAGSASCPVVCRAPQRVLFCVLCARGEGTGGGGGAPRGCACSGRCARAWRRRRGCRASARPRPPRPCPSRRHPRPPPPRAPPAARGRPRWRGCAVHAAGRGARAAADAGRARLREASAARARVVQRRERGAAGEDRGCWEGARLLFKVLQVREEALRQRRLRRRARERPTVRENARRCVGRPRADARAPWLRARRWSPAASSSTAALTLCVVRPLSSE